MPTDPRIDAYIAKAPPFAQPILIHLRALVHATISDAGETINWGMPCLTYQGKNLAGMAAFKAHASFGVHGDGRAIEGMGQYGKIHSMADMPSDAVIAKGLRASGSMAGRRRTGANTLNGSPRPNAPKPVPSALLRPGHGSLRAKSATGSMRTAEI